MKFSKLFFLFALIFSNHVIADPLMKKSEIIKKSNECFNNLNYMICKNLILQTENIQLIEFRKNRYKCQSSVLGLQTELIKANYFRDYNNNERGIMIPYVIKNCKF